MIAWLPVNDTMSIFCKSYEFEKLQKIKNLYVIVVHRLKGFSMNNKNSFFTLHMYIFLYQWLRTVDGAPVVLFSILLMQGFV